MFSNLFSESYLSQQRVYKYYLGPREDRYHASECMQCHKSCLVNPMGYKTLHCYDIMVFSFLNKLFYKNK